MAMATNWIGWMLSILVFILLFVVGAILQHTVRLLITGKKTDAVVVGMAKSPGTAGQDSLQAPIYEFVALNGGKISASSSTYATSPSAKLGDSVTVVYNPSLPQDAQLLLFKEFGIVFVLLGFIAVIILMWISAILISGDATLDDPFRILPAVISRFQLNPVRFPLFFLLSIVIPVCGITTYALSKDLIELTSNGIKVVGHVTGTQSENTRLNDGSLVSGNFPMISYEDVSGEKHTIRSATVSWLSSLKTGDVVEVIYPPRHPEKGVLNTWGELYPPTLFFGFVTLAFLVLLVLVLNRTICP